MPVKRKDREKKQYQRMLAQIKSPRPKATPGVGRNLPTPGSTEESQDERAKSSRGLCAQGVFAWRGTRRPAVLLPSPDAEPRGRKAARRAGACSAPQAC